jgi:hypothetical protein
MSDSGATARKRAFILMPFDESSEWIYQDVLAPALDRAGFDALRADSVLDQQNILKDIVIGIRTSDLIIADISVLNPNVMYELGLAHGLERPTIMITQNLEVLPFDLRAYRVIPYSKEYREMTRLIENIESVAAAHARGEISFGNPVTDFSTHEVAVSNNSAVDVAQTGTTGPVVNEIPEEEQFGVLDYVVKFEEVSPQIIDWFNRASSSTNDFVRNMEARVAEVNKINPDDPRLAQLRRAVAASAAQLITTWAEQLEAELPAGRAAWQEMSEATEGLVSIAELDTDEDRAGARELIEEMTTFTQTIDESVSRLNNARTAIDDLRRISRDLARSVSRSNRVLSEVADTMLIGKSLAARVITVMQEKLDESE